MPKPNKEIKQLLINDFGYEPVELESYTGQLRALKESFNSLQIKNPKDARLKELAIAIKDLKAQKEVEKSGGKLKTTRKRRKDSKSAEQIKAEIDAKDKAIADRKAKKKKDAMNFISPGSKPADLPPAENTGGGDMSSSLMKISENVNIIRGIVESGEKLEKDKMDDTREAREKKKRSMAENLMEGTKGAVKAVTGALGKVLSPVKGIFMQIFDFLTKFLLGAGLMKLLDWMGNPENKSKLSSIFKFLKDYWPAIITALMAFVPGFPVLAGVIALAVGFLPKLINLIKSIFGFGKQVDKEIADNEKTLEQGDEIKEDVTIKEEGGQEPVEGGADDAGATVKPETGAGETPNVQEKKFNKGGAVPGQGNTDTVPAMLTPGEFVLTKDAVKKYGTDTLYGMNAAAGGVDKSNDVPRGPSGKPMRKKSTVQTMMDKGGLNTINNISKSISNNTSKSTSDVTNNTSKSDTTNNMIKTMNMSGGGMTKNTSYMGGGGMTKNTSYMNSGGLVNNIGETSNVQHMKFGGMVKNFISKTPQARLLKFAANQISKTPQARALKFAANQVKKLPVKPPVAKALKALKGLGMKNTPPSPMPTEAGGSSVNEIPTFSVIASGGRAKEQTLGIRR